MRRYFLIIAGLFFVAVGGVGVVVPGLPTTIFILLAAGCFAKSCPALHRWLLENRLFGPMIYHWEKNRAIPRRARKMALLMIGTVGVFSIYLIEGFYLKVFVAVMLIIPVVILLRLKTVDEALPRVRKTLPGSPPNSD
ncbi:MAG: YbaN family protein [Gammaproteobacteria bacterium]|nr:YbaN family protein [Gammaproteobacteria bacterium]